MPRRHQARPFVAWFAPIGRQRHTCKNLLATRKLYRPPPPPRWSVARGASLKGRLERPHHLARGTAIIQITPAASRALFVTARADWSGGKPDTGTSPLVNPLHDRPDKEQ
jgi:hypothetical protein